MCKPLPIRKFRWSNKMFGEEEIAALNPNAKKNYILEVDLEYLCELHEAHNVYPLAPEKKRVQSEWLSPYQKCLLEKLGQKAPQTEKLLHDKEKYVVHYRTLKVKQVHQVLEFEKECWMKNYILINTKYRKNGKSEFEKGFYKLMNNSVFGKTMENLRKRTDIKLVRPNEQRKINKLMSSLLYAAKKEMASGLMAIHMHKSHLKLDKPVYTGMTILDGSKNLM